MKENKCIYTIYRDYNSPLSDSSFTKFESAVLVANMYFDKLFVLEEHTKQVVWKQGFRDYEIESMGFSLALGGES